MSELTLERIVYLIVGAIIGLIVREYGTVILKWIIKPFVWLQDYSHKKLAPRFPNLFGYPAYKNAILRSNLARIENPICTSVEVPLEHAFAPLRLISKGSDEFVDDLFKPVEAMDRLIIIGGPGTGKTTIVKNVVVSIIKKLRSS
ncbi:MAG TPA: hypothetical protein VJL89_12240 [Thermodesulfovibrionia bacterium]|nr:hypothetical protein [Thermodesulfovibrionia bacterium]